MGAKTVKRGYRYQSIMSTMLLVVVFVILFLLTPKNVDFDAEIGSNQISYGYTVPTQ